MRLMACATGEQSEYLEGCVEHEKGLVSEGLKDVMLVGVHQGGPPSSAKESEKGETNEAGKNISRSEP